MPQVAPDAVLNAKTKAWDKISKHMTTDEQGLARYKSFLLTTAHGPCRASLTSANIR